jgi:hypothetical protein
MIDGYLGFSAIDWQRHAQSTLAQHLREQEKSILRNYLIGALVQNGGRVLYNESGRGFTWPVLYKLHEVQGDVGMGLRSFQPTSQFQTAGLPYRGYHVTDSISRGEFLQNRGPEAVINIFNGMGERMNQSLSQKLGPMYYVDGAATGNEKGWHGFETMYGANGTTNITSGATRNTQRAANAADPTGYADDTYAEIDTELGAYGGQAESNVYWLEGDPSTEYDVWTPPIINYTSSYFSATATFEANGRKAMRYLLTHGSRRGGKDRQPSNIALARNLWIQFLNAHDSKQQINVGTGLVEWELGFGETQKFDGASVTPDTAAPNSCGYAFNPKNITIRCQTGQMFEPESEPYSSIDQSYKFVVSHAGNLQFENPAMFPCLKALA